MPYTMATLPDAIKKKGKKEQRQWLQIWNSAYKKCIADGGSTASCETSAFKQANGVLKKEKDRDMSEDQTRTEAKSLLIRMWDRMVRELLPPDTPLAEPLAVERSINLDRLRTQVYRAVRESSKNSGEYDYYYPVDVYMDNGSFFALVGRNGAELWQIPFTTANDDVELGEWTRVVEEFTPVATSNNRSIRVVRQADGKARYFAKACSAVVNRVNEIDSTALFDSFIEYAEENEDYPILQFYHQGEAFRIGESDWLGREGVIYLQSGVFDDTPIGRAAAKALEGDGEGYWGTSIGYEPLDKPELIEVARGVKIPVYKKGRNGDLSLLPEQEAASYFTGLSVQMEVERAMNAKQQEVLKKLFGTDEDGYKKFLEDVEGVNRTVESEKLIHREKDMTQPKEGEEKGTTPTEPTKELNSVVEIDIEAETRRAINEVVRSAFAEELKTSQEALAKISGQLEKVLERVDGFDTRLENVEKDEEEKVRAIVADMPNKPSIRVTHRASANAETVPAAAKGSDEKATGVLSTIPSTFYPKAPAK